MSYIQTIQMIFNILYTLLGLVFAHFCVFAIIGIFRKKSYPKTDEKLKYAVIIPARNEQEVISGLIKSVKRNNYPQENLKIFVIAHNCTDKTAEIARAQGAIVYEYNNPKENTMGYAFKYLFSQIEKDFGILSFDGFFMFNADNLLDKNYVSNMNDAFLFYGKKNIITSYRNSKNFGKNLISGLYGMYFAVGCRMESRGRTFMGCSTRVQGTGYLISSDIVKDGWNYVTLAEDWEFSADRVLLGNRICYCDDAVFYDEQPTSFKIMWRQRLRWSRGHFIVFFTRIKDLIKGILSPKTKNRGSVYDITANVLTPTIILIILQILQLTFYFTAPLVDKTLTLKSLFIESGFLIGYLKSFLSFYFTIALNAVITFTVERKRIKNVSKTKKILITLLWPFFVMIQTFIDIKALFSTKLEWKPIPHNDKTTFEDVN